MMKQHYCQVCSRALRVNQKKYCSHKCFGAPERGSNHHHFVKKVSVTCNDCGKRFEVIPSKAARNRRFFCSIACRNASRKGITHEERLAERDAHIVVLYQQYGNLALVAAEIGCSVGTVRNRLRYHDIKPKAGRIPPNKLNLDSHAVTKCYGKVKSLRVTARRFKCSTPVIRRILREQGIKADGRAKHTKESKRKLAAAIKRTHAAGKMRGKNHWNWQGAKVETECCICGKKIKRWRKRLKRPVCGIECNAKRAAVDLRGENAPMWLGGKSFEPYPIEWRKTLKKSIRQRDTYRCRLCGKSQKQNQRALSVHHIDYDKKNLDPKNLTSLCGNCHIKTNTNRRHWTRYFKNMMEKVKSA